jgi:Winged helix DNA-binding domain
MDEGTALGLRMTSLLLRGGGPSTVAGIVEWFGAMQAQDLNSALWSLGCRLPRSTIEDVNAALEERAVLRTWPMRGTVHFVPAADAHWMLELMGVRALGGAAKRRETLGLDEKTVDRAVEILGSALAGGGRMTRAECLGALTEGGVEVTGQRGYHLLWYASQRAVTAIAPHVGKEQTFVLLDDWVPAPRRPDREEALGIMALRYFRSHGPATRKDFAGWTGLPMTDCKTGIAVAGDALTETAVDGVEMIMAADVSPSVFEGWRALPGFDEYMLGYADRALMVDAAHLPAIVPGGNGVFQSTIVRDGRVAGTWKRTTGAKQTTVEIRPLVPLPARERARVEKAFAAYGSYTGKALRFRWLDEAMTKANSA